MHNAWECLRNDSTMSLLISWHGHGNHRHIMIRCLVLRKYSLINTTVTVLWLRKKSILNKLCKLNIQLGISHNIDAILSNSAFFVFLTTTKLSVLI